MIWSSILCNWLHWLVSKVFQAERVSLYCHPVHAESSQHAHCPDDVVAREHSRIARNQEARSGCLVDACHWVQIWHDIYEWLDDVFVLPLVERVESLNSWSRVRNSAISGHCWNELWQTAAQWMASQHNFSSVAQLNCVHKICDDFNITVYQGKRFEHVSGQVHCVP